MKKLATKLLELLESVDDSKSPLSKIAGVLKATIDLNKDMEKSLVGVKGVQKILSELVSSRKDDASALKIIDDHNTIAGISSSKRSDVKKYFIDSMRSIVFAKKEFKNNMSKIDNITSKQLLTFFKRSEDFKKDLVKLTKAELK